MENKRRLSRLGAKLAGVSVLGLVLAFAIFYTVDSLVLPWLLYDERFAPFWEARADAVTAEFQDYVTEHSLTVQQAAEWQSIALDLSTEVLTIVVKDVSCEPSDFKNAEYYTWSIAEEPMVVSSAANPAVEMRQIQCADGTLYLADAAGVLQVRDSVRIAGLLLALLGFCGMVLPCIVRLVRRIGVLSRETGVLMAGDLDHSIHIKGKDELSGLGEDIERLRQSVLSRLEGERQAVRANNTLITSLSHDLRTPLTKLTGYLDILSYGRYQDQAEHDDFIRLASEKAAQIKALTDQLFASAQVDAPAAGLEQPPEVADGPSLLGQLLAEQCDDLQREGFDAQPPMFCQAFQLYLHTEDMVRIFDNLFSNLKKYADPAFPVTIRFQDHLEYVTLTFQNHILPAPDRADSHGLGVPTMKALTARTGGTLEISALNDIYTSILTLPKYRSPR